MAYEQRSQSRTRRAGASIPVVHSHPPPAPPPPTTPHFLDPKKKTPYTIQRDYRVLEREKRVTTILNDERFRSELESILQGQKDASTHPKMTNLQKLQDEASSSSPSRVTRATGVVGSATAAVIPIDDLRGVSGSKYTVAERQTRCKLAAVYRLVDMFGWSQLIYNSITVSDMGALCYLGTHKVKHPLDLYWPMYPTRVLVWSLYFALCLYYTNELTVHELFHVRQNSSFGLHIQHNSVLCLFTIVANNNSNTPPTGYMCIQDSNESMIAISCRHALLVKITPFW